MTFAVPNGWFCPPPHLQSPALAAFLAAQEKDAGK